MPNTNFIGHTALYVNNPQQIADFYTQAFGLAIAFSAMDGHYIELKLSSNEGAPVSTTRLGIAAKSLLQEWVGQPEHITTAAPSPTTVISLCVTGIQAVYDQALTLGATAIAPPDAKPWGHTLAFIADPSGQWVELFEKTNKR